VDRLEIDQQLLDRQIQTKAKEKDQVYFSNDPFGQGMDKKSQIQQDVLVNIEIQNRKIET